MLSLSLSPHTNTKTYKLTEYTQSKTLLPVVWQEFCYKSFSPTKVRKTHKCLHISSPHQKGRGERGHTVRGIGDAKTEGKTSKRNTESEVTEGREYILWPSSVKRPPCQQHEFLWNHCMWLHWPLSNNVTRERVSVKNKPCAASWSMRCSKCTYEPACVCSNTHTTSLSQSHRLVELQSWIVWWSCRSGQQWVNTKLD